MPLEISRKARAIVSDVTTALRPHFGTLCRIAAPPTSMGAVERYSAYLFDWFALDESTRQQFASIYGIGLNENPRKEWLFCFGIVPQRSLAWYERRAKEYPSETPDRLVRTLLMNQPVHFLLCEALTGAIHLSSAGAGCRWASGLAQLSIEAGAKPGG